MPSKFELEDEIINLKNKIYDLQDTISDIDNLIDNAVNLIKILEEKLNDSLQDTDKELLIRIDKLKKSIEECQEI